MAIKFSQFVVKTSSSDLSHIVGYNGVDNIQITPTNFLNTALTGTAGQVLFYDTTGVTGDNDLYWNNTNKRLGIGTASPLQKLHVTGSSDGNSIYTALLQNSGTAPGTASKLFFVQGGSTVRGAAIGGLQEATAGSPTSMVFETSAAYATPTERMRIDSSGNVGIGTASPTEKLQVDGNIKVGDSQQFVAGDGNDLQISHNGTDTQINNLTGNLQFTQLADDKDISFASDNGSGGDTIYMTIDGSATLINVSAPNGMQFNDNIRIKVGSGSGGDLRLFHNANDSIIQNTTGDLYIENTADNKDIIFLTDNGSGGTVPYMTVDGANEVTSFQKSTKHEDNVVAYFGNASDLSIYHDSSNSYVQSSGTGDLIIEQRNDDKDIVFNCDDGSGGVATYLRLDGSTKTIDIPDSIPLAFGSSDDLKIYHEGTDSIIQNYTGSIYVDNNADDQDIIFRCDDGSGGLETYFYLDGSAGRNVSNKNFRIIDSKKLSFGSDDDLQIQHSSGTNIIDSTIGDLIVKVSQDDGDIIFQSDEKATQHLDNVIANFGSSSDLQVYHNGTDSYILNGTGDLQIINSQDDGDIIFKSDDGSGGTETYFFLDGSSSKTVFPDNKQIQIGGGGGDGYIYSDGTNMWIQGNNPSADGGVAEYFAVDGGEEQVRFFKDTEHADSVSAYYGNAGDLQIYHNGSNSLIENNTGNLNIINYADDQDIIFRCDDGSGGITEYFRVDGSSEKIIYSKNQWLYDNIRAVFGSSDDLQIYHNGTNSLIENSAGDFYISNKQDDGDIIFFCDDGSGGTTEYFRLDGSNTNMNASKTIVFNDRFKNIAQWNRFCNNK